MNTRIVGLLTALMLAASACGAASAGPDAGAVAESGEVAALDTAESPDAEQVTDDEVDTEAQLLLFAECLRGEGFDIDDPTVDADGNVLLPRPSNGGVQGQGPPEGFVEARDTCAEHLEGVTLGFGGGGGGNQAELQDQLLEFSGCMRDNGFDLPDPDFSVGGGRGLLAQVDRDDPAYQAAFANCDDILGGFGGGGPAGS